MEPRQKQSRAKTRRGRDEQSQTRGKKQRRAKAKSRRKNPAEFCAIDEEMRESELTGGARSYIVYLYRIAQRTSKRV